MSRMAFSYQVDRGGFDARWSLGMVDIVHSLPPADYVTLRFGGSELLQKLHKAVHEGLELLEGERKAEPWELEVPFEVEREPKLFTDEEGTWLMASGLVKLDLRNLMRLSDVPPDLREQLMLRWDAGGGETLRVIMEGAE